MRGAEARAGWLPWKRCCRSCFSSRRRWPAPLPVGAPGRSPVCLPAPPAGAPNCPGPSPGGTPPAGFPGPRTGPRTSLPGRQPRALLGPGYQRWAGLDRLAAPVVGFPCADGPFLQLPGQQGPAWRSGSSSRCGTTSASRPAATRPSRSGTWSQVGPGGCAAAELLPAPAWPGLAMAQG